MKKILALTLLLLSVFTLSACNDERSTDKLQVVTTTTYIGDMLKQVGGNYIEVIVLMDVGVDPHDYQPRQSDTQKVANADLLVANGLNLEERMGEVFRNVENEKLLILGDYVDEASLLREENGEIDPHIWFDLEIWMDLISVVVDRLSTLDSDNSDIFEKRGQEYVKDLEILDLYIKSRVETLDESKRILVTAHDAFAYFGNAYGFDVYAVQGISTESEASISDIENLAALLVELDVRKVFWETSVPQSTVNALIEATEDLDHDVSVGGELYSDSTGGASQGHETLIRTYRYNVDLIIDSLME